jgi:tetratricopeptide (TPR) repeat protein
VAGVAAKQALSREAARRQVGISERQLQSWEKQKLLAPASVYGFRDLIALRTLVKLKQARRPAKQIRDALAALRRKLSGVSDPLTQLRIFVDGRRIRVDVDGQAMEADSGQMLLNFDEGEIKRLVEFKPRTNPHEGRDRRLAAERWFQRGLELEQTGAAPEKIIEAYTKALEFDPDSAGALVNLGTIHFNAREWKEAEAYYLKAIEVDPDYALAHFDLANLYDERGIRSKALEHYEAALRVAPNYADAHYNLALLHQSIGQTMKAAHHWRIYLKLDPSSNWAAIARRELAKLRDAAVVQPSGSSA